MALGSVLEEREKKPKCEVRSESPAPFHPHRTLLSEGCSSLLSQAGFLFLRLAVIPRTTVGPQ